VRFVVGTGTSRTCTAGKVRDTGLVQHFARGLELRQFRFALAAQVAADSGPVRLAIKPIIFANPDELKRAHIWDQNFQFQPPLPGSPSDRAQGILTTALKGCESSALPSSILVPITRCYRRILGADVILVEQPGMGDPARGPSGMSPFFASTTVTNGVSASTSSRTPARKSSGNS